MAASLQGGHCIKYKPQSMFYSYKYNVTKPNLVLPLPEYFLRLIVICCIFLGPNN
jgi:hypothetical protein